MSTILEDFCPTDLGFDLHKFAKYRAIQQAAIGLVSESEKRFVGLALPTGCHAPGQRILMFDGSRKKVEDIRVGDEVMGWDSTPRGVTQLFNGMDDMYRIIPVKGDSFDVNHLHVLSLYRSRQGYDYECEKPTTMDLTVTSYLRLSKWHKHLLKLFRTGVTFPYDREFFIKPYHLGLLLGDGSIQYGASITTNDEEIRAEIFEFAEKNGTDIRLYEDDMHLVTYKHQRGKSDQNQIINELQRLHLYGVGCEEKFIPFEYMTASDTDRLELLAGLLDTDGYLHHCGYDFISKSPQLAHDIVLISRSVGLAAYLNPCVKSDQHRTRGVYYRVSISGCTSDIPCRVQRKIAPERQQVKDVLVTGFSVEHIGVGEYFGFMIEGDGRYVLGDFTVTHNSGKSLVAASIQKLTGWRTVILTATRGLQSQYLRDFESCGLTDIRGRQNYGCSVLTRLNCSDGKRAGCASDEDCTYARAKNRAGDMVVTNYKYWLSIHGRLYRDDEPIDCLVLDEAHEAPELLADYMAVRLYDKELVELLGWEDARDLKDDIQGWIKAVDSWSREAGMQSLNMNRIIESKGSKVTRAELVHAARLEELADKLAKIENMDVTDWTCDMKSSQKFGVGWEFDLIWPGMVAESKLFFGIEHVVLMSATLRPKTMSLLGINKEQYEFKEWPRIFQPSRCPIYYLPARTEEGHTVRINFRSSDDDLRLWLEWIDRIIDSRLDRKGIIHTVSYSRQKYLIENSQHSQRMIGNTDDPESMNANEIYNKFIDSAYPLILVSPSFSTGWDFNGDQAEWQIICKIPFPPGKSKVMKARQEKDKQYLNYLTMQELVQSCGRIMRHELDRGETFIVEGNFGWFIQQNKQLAPRWFSDGVRAVRDIPRVPEKLYGKNNS